jgi:Lysosomal transcription factor, NCU-G1
LSAFGSSKHGDDLPHLYHGSDSIQIDLIAKNLNYMNYSSPRIAVEYLIVSSENKSEGSFKLKKRRNLDDEFTPGIFDVQDIVSPRSAKDGRGSFFQYRPVCYTSKDRTVSDSTELRQGKISSFNKNQKDIEKFAYTLPYSYYGYSLGSKVAQGMNITFGVPADGFYSRSNYVSFSMLMGIGAPPIEGLSAFVITFAVIGLGVPLLVLLIGGIYVAIKRYRN